MSRVKELIEDQQSEYLEEKIVYETQQGIVEYEKCDIS